MQLKWFSNPRHEGEEASGKLDVSFLFPQGRIHSSENMQVWGQGEGEGGSLAGPEKVSEQFSKLRESNVFKKKVFIFRENTRVNTLQEVF